MSSPNVAQEPRDGAFLGRDATWTPWLVVRLAHDQTPLAFSLRLRHELADQAQTAIRRLRRFLEPSEIELLVDGAPRPTPDEALHLALRLVATGDRELYGSLRERLAAGDVRGARGLVLEDLPPEPGSFRRGIYFAVRKLEGLAQRGLVPTDHRETFDAAVAALRGLLEAR